MLNNLTINKVEPLYFYLSFTNKDLLGLQFIILQ
jgi:hypothetical protein